MVDRDPALAQAKKPARLVRARVVARALALLLVSTASAAQSAASARYPLDAATARERIVSAITRHRDEPGAGQRYHVAYPFASALFPSDDELRVFEASKPRRDALVRWLRLSTDARRFDVLVAPAEDYYWKVADAFDAKPADFQAAFIVHLATDGGAIAPEVVQIRSTVRLGKRFDALGRTGPGFYWDIRPVAPSGRADDELLAFLATALRAPGH